MFNDSDSFGQDTQLYYSNQSHSLEKIVLQVYYLVYKFSEGTVNALQLKSPASSGDIVIKLQGNLAMRTRLK